MKFLELFLIFACLSGLCFTAYSNGLHNAFMWDDRPIFSDIKIKNIKYLPNAFIFHSAPSHKSDSFIDSNIYYRPMAYVITVLSYLAFGDNPFGYHTLNLFLFILMCCTVYTFIDLFFKDKLLAFITSALFAVHPINVFFVDYITSGIHSVRFIAMFLSLFFFLKALDGVHKYIFYPASFILFIMALLCHETSVVLPFYAVFAIFYYRQTSLKDAAFKSFPYWLVLGLYLLFRFLCTGLGSTLPAAHINPVIYLATFSKIIFLYVSKLFCPQGIFFFWNSPWMTGLNAFIWLAGLIAVLGGWRLLARQNTRNITFFCVTWLLLGFIPVVLAAFPPYDKIYYGLIMEPQWVTFGSVGFFVLAAFIGIKVFALEKRTTALLFICLLAVLIGMVRRENTVWGNEYNYYFYWSQQIRPLPPVNYAYLADLALRKKEFAQARYYLSKTLEKKHDASDYNNLGLMDEQQGSMEKAKKEFLLSIATDPNFSAAYNNLGSVYFNQKDYPAAKNAFLSALRLDKYSIEAGSNLGLICLLQGDYRGAVHYYGENLEIVPYDEDSLFGLVQAYAGLKDKDGVNKYSQILMTHGKDPAILASLRKLLASLKQNTAL